jgi:hypothetical protein
MASLPEGPGVNRANIFNRVIGGTAIEVLVTLRAAAAGRDTCSTRVPQVCANSRVQASWIGVAAWWSGLAVVL